MYMLTNRNRNDFCVYNGLDQIIVSAGLVAPRKGVFVETIKHLLILTTPVEVVVLEVYFNENNVNAEINLLPCIMLYSQITDFRSWFQCSNR